MNTPNVIYLQTCGDCGGLECKNCTFEQLYDSGQVTWRKDKINDSDTAYFSEDAVRKEIETILKRIVAYGKRYCGSGFTLNRNIINNTINNLKKSANEEYRIVGSVLNGSRN